MIRKYYHTILIIKIPPIFPLREHPNPEDLFKKRMEQEACKPIRSGLHLEKFYQTYKVPALD
jgi:hypothetical protein